MNWTLVGNFFLILILTVCLTKCYDGEEKDDTGCPRVFKQRCSCGKVSNYHYWRSNEEIFLVNCTNTNFKDTKMLELLPAETQVLIFNGNNIPQLDWNIFGIWDEHDNLEVVDLTNNNIRGISGKSFHKVKNVKRLVLDHNDLIISGPNLHSRLFSNFYNLEELHLTNTFTETVDSRWYLSDLKEILLASNMTKLRKLHLEQNEIWEIKDDDMFCGLKSLSELHLGDNQLQSIDFSIDCLEQLEYLNLEYNKIRRLSNRTLEKIETAFAKDKTGRKTLNLSGNPFRCDCHLSPFYQWLRKTKIPFFHKEELRCFDGFPLGNAGRLILDLQRLECEPPPSASAEVSTGSYAGTVVAFVIVIIILVSIIAYMVYYNQKYGIKIRPLMENLQKSMQYRTINKEDELTTSPPEVNV